MSAPLPFAEILKRATQPDAVKASELQRAQGNYERRKAYQQLSERCSPEAMTKVLAALEMAQIACTPFGPPLNQKQAADKIRAALSALNPVE